MSPPLALQLHYLLTAIASDDDDVIAHRILGKAMSILHDHAVLDRAELEAALAEAGVHAQFERVRLTPMPLSVEDISKLWTAFQTQYRVTAAYQASTVLIDGAPSTSPLPVLRRGRHDPEGPTAVAGGGPIVAAVAPDLGGLEQRFSFPARPGDRLTITGSRLGGAGSIVRFRCQRLAAPVDETVAVESSADRLLVDLPAPLPAGYATLSVLVPSPGGEPVSSNQVPVPIAPVITRTPASAAGPAFTLTITATPPPDPAQQPLLLVGDRQVAPDSIAGSTLTFALTGLEEGTYTLRLRVDGVDSIPLAAPSPGTAPDLSTYDQSQQVVVT